MWNYHKHLSGASNYWQLAVPADVQYENGDGCSTSVADHFWLTDRRFNGSKGRNLADCFNSSRNRCMLLGCDDRHPGDSPKDCEKVKNHALQHCAQPAMASVEILIAAAADARR